MLVGCLPRPGFVGAICQRDVSTGARSRERNAASDAA